MAQKPLAFSAALAGAALAVGIAVGFALGRSLAPRSLGPEDAAPGYVPRSDFDAVSAKVRELSARLEAATAEKAKLEAEAFDLAGKVAELASRLEESERRESEAAPLAAAHKGLPIAFGEYAGLEGLEKADWGELAAAFENLSALLAQVAKEVKEGGTLDAETQKKIAAENAKLVQLAGAIMGKIPTHSPINGEFTHPITIANLMAAVLERNGVPLSAEQRAVFERLGTEYEAQYRAVDEKYSEDTPRLRKIVDELELKRDFFGKMEEVLRDDQAKLLFRPETRNRVQVDLLSPANSAIFIAQPVEIANRDDLPGKLSSFLKGYGLEGIDESAVVRIAADWAEELAPLLGTPVDPREPVHLEELIAAGRAQANAVAAILALPGLSEKSRAAILNSPGWYVPRLVARR